MSVADDSLHIDIPVHLDEMKVVFSVAVVADLLQKGAQVELCGATAKANGWRNADLIPGIKINRNAMARLTQLAQQGFVKISEA